MYAARYFPPRYFPERYFVSAATIGAGEGPFPERYFATSYFAPRYFPTGDVTVTPTPAEDGYLVFDIDGILALDIRSEA